MTKPHRLQQLLAAHPGRAAGIYSVCSAHPWVIRAAAEQALEDHSLLLIEATSNQVNQDGGYTGMRPAHFRTFVEEIVTSRGLSLDNLILGGDHLGPNPWRHLPAHEAMHHARQMVAEYVAAGFTKIHLDASMPCAGDDTTLSDEQVATRAAQLCATAEAAAYPDEPPIYVIGTEVPTPGGATHALDGLQVTPAVSAAHTLAVHKTIFAQQGLASVWPRILALVVQPGVEFGHDSVIQYQPAKAQELVHWLRNSGEAIVFEAHSTDYQNADAYRCLVEDNFCILKVGPALTFALREALYALADIEAQLIPLDQRSNLASAVEETMLATPRDWQSHYHGTPQQLHLLRLYSYSDRIRYYWQQPQVAASVATLIANLDAHNVPESMLSRYLPAQYARVRTRAIPSDPISLIVDKIRNVLRIYAAAC